MALFIVLGLISTFTMGVPPMPANMAANPMVTPGMIASIGHSSAIVGSIIAAICVYFYWKGHEWARWLVMIDAVLVLLLALGIRTTWANSTLGGMVTIGKTILAIYLLWYLNTAPVKAWFKIPKTGSPGA
jgi:hypothetical protein